MDAELPPVRLRQAVIAAGSIEPLASRLAGELGLVEPFRDPGVAAFGLENAVFAIGDCFLEIVAPIAPATAAARQMERAGGDCGYMVLFDVRDLDGARRRAAAAGVRAVWEIELPDIAATHLHPADMHGAIVSVDRSEPQGSWRWGGPGWTARRGIGAPGRLAGVTVAVADPAATCARWAEILGVQAGPGEAIALGDAEVWFRACQPGAEEGIASIRLALAPDVRAGREEIDLGAVRIALADLPS